MAGGQYGKRERCSDREEFHNFLIAHTTKAPLIYIYISRADGTVLRPGIVELYFSCRISAKEFATRRGFSFVAKLSAESIKRPARCRMRRRSTWFPAPAPVKFAIAFRGARRRSMASSANVRVGRPENSRLIIAGENTTEMKFRDSSSFSIAEYGNLALGYT